MIDHMRFCYPKEQQEFNIASDVNKKGGFNTSFFFAEHVNALVALNDGGEDGVMLSMIKHDQHTLGCWQEEMFVSYKNLDDYIRLQGPRLGWYNIENRLYYVYSHSPVDTWAYGWNKMFIRTARLYQTGKMKSVDAVGALMLQIFRSCHDNKFKATSENEMYERLADKKPSVLSPYWIVASDGSVRYRYFCVGKIDRASNSFTSIKSIKGLAGDLKNYLPQTSQVFV